MKARVRFGMVVLAAVIGTPALAAERIYDLPGHGALVVKAPEGWQDEAAYPPGGLPPTLHFVPSAGERFEMMVTPLWNGPGAPPDFGSPASVRALVQSAVDGAAPQAAEGKLQLRELSGANHGYYFSATDKAPRPGEFKYLTQGAVIVDGLVCTFTILTDRPDSAVVHQGLTLAGSLRHAGSVR